MATEARRPTPALPNPFPEGVLRQVLNLEITADGGPLFPPLPLARQPLHILCWR